MTCPLTIKKAARRPLFVRLVLSGILAFVACTAVVTAAPGRVGQAIKIDVRNVRAEPLDALPNGVVHRVSDDTAARDEIEFVHAQFADFVIHVTLLSSPVRATYCDGTGRGYPP